MRPEAWSERLQQREAWAVQCRWVFPVPRAPITGLLTIASGRVVAVGRNDSGAAPLDLGPVALLPGLVNAHTHLELSDIAAPLGRPGMPLPDWIRLVIDWNRGLDPDAGGGRRREAHRAGLQESASRGVVLAGDIVNPPWDEKWHQSGCSVVAFRELLSLDAAAIPDRLVDAKWHLRCDHWRVTPALSPHAPYSTHPDLVRQAVAAAVERDEMVAMHLAESPEELELLRSGGGPFRELLDSLGAWRPGAIAPGARVLDYLQMLAAAPAALVVHGNHLDQEERQFLADRRESMAVAYCPRTHDYFGHEPYPLAELLRRGVRVVLGTDSRASNPDLCVLSEWRAAARLHPAVAPAKLLEMVTTAGAAALRRPSQASLDGVPCGLLTVVPLGEASLDPYQQLLEGGPPRPLEAHTPPD